MEESTKEGKIYSDYLDNWSVGIPKNFSSLSVLDTYIIRLMKENRRKKNPYVYIIHVVCPKHYNKYSIQFFLFLWY